MQFHKNVIVLVFVWTVPLPGPQNVIASWPLYTASIWGLLLFVFG